MRLWNRKNPDSSSVTPNVNPKRRLRESNSIEDGPPNIQSSGGLVKSPKPSAKSKKMDQEHHISNSSRKTFSQLVQNHDTRNHSESKKGKRRQFKVFFFPFLNIFGVEGHSVSKSLSNFSPSMFWRENSFFQFWHFASIFVR